MTLDTAQSRCQLLTLPSEELPSTSRGNSSSMARKDRHSKRVEAPSVGRLVYRFEERRTEPRDEAKWVRRSISCEGSCPVLTVGTACSKSCQTGLKRTSSARTAGPAGTGISDGWHTSKQLPAETAGIKQSASKASRSG